MASGFAGGVSSVSPAIQQAIQYRKNLPRATANAAVDARNQQASDNAATLARSVQPNTDGTHDYLGDMTGSFPSGYSATSIIPDVEE
jgi:hypothetical protein